VELLIGYEVPFFDLCFKDSLKTDLMKTQKSFPACRSHAFLVLFLILPFTLSAVNPPESKSMEINESDHEISQDHLVVLWTSGDPEVAHKMVFMYTFNAKKRGWWKDITFIIWGPSARLSSENKEIAETLVKMKDSGIEMLACKACADLYGCSPDLEDLGIEVKYMGVALTDYIKKGMKVITF
jgi:hypothetical protein